MDKSKFNDGNVHFINSGWEWLRTSNTRVDPANSFTVGRSKAVFLLQFHFVLFVLCSLENCFMLLLHVIETLFGAIEDCFP